MGHDERARTHAQRAVELALANVEEGGKPFGCVVVGHATGEVVHEATTQVAQSGDVSAHAEITAMRELAAAGRTDLSGCDVHVTAYPCPTCLGALYYAAPAERESLLSMRVATDDPTAPLREWTSGHGG